jgi:outer membrane lipoprotein-sorting protein
MDLVKRPFKKWVMAIVVLIVVGCLSANKTAAMNPRDILTDIFKRQGLTGEGSFEINLQVVSFKGEARNDSRVRVFLDDGRKQLVTFIEPERLKDDYYLVNGYNTWMYRKELKRPLRISAQQRLFGNAGIAETAGINYLNDYDIIKATENDGEYLIELQAKDGRTAYQRASMWISKSSLRISKIILKALNGQELKSLLYGDYRMVDGHEMAVIEINNLLQNMNEKTIIKYTGIKSRTFDPEIFDPLMMGKISL